MKIFFFFFNALSLGLSLCPVSARAEVKHLDLSSIEAVAEDVKQAFPRLSSGVVSLSVLDGEVDSLKRYRQDIVDRLKSALFDFCVDLEGEEAKINMQVRAERRSSGASDEDRSRIELIRELRLSCITAETAKREGLQRNPRFWNLYNDLYNEATDEYENRYARAGTCRYKKKVICS